MMELVKSKDAAESLNVSQTTVKRWASYFPHYFQKDRFGHYIFTPQDLAMLGLIKAALERGETMDQIVLPEPQPQPEPENENAQQLIKLQALQESASAMNEAVQEVAAAAATLEQTDLQTRLRNVERRLDQKADEVVVAQVLQHREELDELRRMVDMLATSIEMSRKPSMAELQAAAAETAASSSNGSPSRKRGLFRSLFVWF
ncbi:chromosome-anchoring protein RacA [Paenibacillus taihuensis]|uniref:Chromosome-anchoring protein RacA n=1 Tax=Paenibacillus taihuensis TaxID=1156355 RepID=A0A3D9S370_9BACL|nr:MerR family transcriptional regulator [Paenibacillus taihuensis]REE86465.1 chromosome-anchoring protein RacA [Paenibacillus taihuensis]